MDATGDVLSSADSSSSFSLASISFSSAVRSGLHQRGVRKKKKKTTTLHAIPSDISPFSASSSPVTIPMLS
jgi:hypothetical protein